VPCEVTSTGDGGLRILLDREQRGVAAGQSAVLYEPDPDRGDRVLGQAAVQTARKRSETVRH
jgi:tRNA-specific 2-thiouridylase